jgi:hypothetical protein
MVWLDGTTCAEIWRKEVKYASVFWKVELRRARFAAASETRFHLRLSALR